MWDYNIFWKETLNQIKAEISEQEWMMWFNNLRYVSSSESAIVLSVPSSFYRDQVQQRYASLLEKKLKDLSGYALKLEFTIVQTEQSETPSPKSTPQAVLGKGPSPVVEKTAEFKQHPLLNREYTFDNFIIGENNSFAANAALAISRNPGISYNPCLIYGGVGLGKTHLVQSIGNAAYQTKNNTKIVYVTAETFMNEFIQAIRNNQNHIFKNKFRSVDILLIDDIHFLENKAETQEELFHTFNALYDAKKQMVFTCDRPVSELQSLTDRLRSRFTRGLNVDLQPPNFETRFAILKQKIEEKKVPIPEEVIDLIARNITTNVRDLEAALEKLTAYADLVGQEVTLSVATKQLKDIFTNTRNFNITVDMIQKVVAEYFSLSPSELKGKKRTKAIAYPRQIAMYICREITEFSTTEVGLEFGGRDHTTVMHAYSRIDSFMKSDPTLEPTIHNLIRQIKQLGSRG